MSEGADSAEPEGREPENEPLFRYIANEFRENPRENIALLVFFLLFGGFLVFWWVTVATSY